jgi:hypothetical protein
MPADDKGAPLGALQQPLIEAGAGQDESKHFVKTAEGGVAHDKVWHLDRACWNIQDAMLGVSRPQPTGSGWARWAYAVHVRLLPWLPYIATLYIAITFFEPPCAAPPFWPHSRRRPAPTLAASAPSQAVVPGGHGARRA